MAGCKTVGRGDGGPAKGMWMVGWEGCTLVFLTLTLQEVAPGGDQQVHAGNGHGVLGEWIHIACARTKHTLGAGH